MKTQVSLMASNLSFVLFIIFVGLGCLHFYWMLGGNWGFDYALPTTIKGNKVLNPSTLDCALVGLGLILFGVFYLVKGRLINAPAPTWIMMLGSWFIPTLFTLRAIGDFKYVGFFKKISQTDFAVWDTLLFSPLCLIIGLIAYFINFFK